MYIVGTEKKEVTTQHLVPDGTLVRVEDRYKNHNGNLTFIKKGSLHGVTEDIYLVGDTRRIHVIDKSTIDGLGKTGDTIIKARVTEHDWVKCINRQGRLAYEQTASDFVDAYTPIEIGLKVPVSRKNPDVAFQAEVVFIGETQFIVQSDGALYMFSDIGLPIKGAMQSDCGILQLGVKYSRNKFPVLSEEGAVDAT
ncbi:hypothetical protein VPHF86_0207 [Vibrio phage F86]